MAGERDYDERWLAPHRHPRAPARPEPDGPDDEPDEDAADIEAERYERWLDSAWGDAR